jgi:hypothetical protein
VLPQGRGEATGKDLGILTTAVNIPQILSPVWSAWLLHVTGAITGPLRLRDRLRFCRKLFRAADPFGALKPVSGRMSPYAMCCSDKMAG